MNKNTIRKSEDWTCDICGQEADNLYFVGDNIYACDSCRKKQNQETAKGK